MASNLKVNIDIILKGAQALAQLASQIKTLQTAAAGISKATSGAANVGAGARAAATSATAQQRALNQAAATAVTYARAMAKQQESAGNLAGAEKTLQKALGITNINRTTAVRVQTELNRVQAKFTATGGGAFPKERENLNLLNQQKAAERAERSIASLAIRTSRLQVAQGDAAGASNTLASAFSRVTASSSAGISIQTQMARLSGVQANANERQAIAGLQLARAEARLQFAQGNRAGAIQTITNALQGMNLKTLAAVNAQTQLVNLQNNFKNSALISSVRAISASLGQAVPGLGLFSRGMERMQAVSGGFQEAMAGAGVSAGSLVGVLGSILVGLTAVVGGFLAAKKAAEGLFSLAKAGIAFNASVEAERFGIATIISSLGKVTIGGEALKGVEKFNASLTLADGLVNQIIEDASRLGLDIDAVMEGFQVSLAPLTRAGLDLEQARTTTISLSLAMRAARIPMRELAQETRAILAGTITRQDRLNQILLITTAELDKAKAEGKVFELFNRKLEAFRTGGLAASTTLNVMFDRAGVAFKKFAGDVTKDTLFKPLEDQFAKLFDPKQFDISGLKVGITDLFGLIGKTAGEVAEWVIQKVQEISVWIGQNRDLLYESTAAALNFAEALVAIPSVFAPLSEDTNLFGVSLGVLKNILNGLTDILFFIEGAVRLTVAVAMLGLADIAVALAKVAQFLTRWIPGASAAIQVFIDDQVKGMDRLADAADHAFDRWDRFRNEAEKGIHPPADLNPGVEGMFLRANLRRMGLDANGNPIPGFIPDKKPPAASKGGSKGSRRPVDEFKERNQLLLAQFAFEKAQAQAKIALAKANEDKESAILERGLADRTIGITAYYDGLAALAQNTSKLVMEALQLELKQERQLRARLIEEGKERIAVAGKSQGKRDTKQNQTARVNNAINDEKQKILKTDGDILTLETKIQTTEIETTAAIAARVADKTNALRQLEQDIAGVGEEIRSVGGDEFGAAILNMENRLRDLRKKAIAEYKEESKEVHQIDELRAALRKQAEGKENQARIDNIRARLAVATTVVQDQVETGALGELEAKEKILAMERAIKKELIAKLELQLAFTQAFQLEGAAKDAKITELYAQLIAAKKLGIDKTLGEITTTLQGDLRGAFDTWFNSTMVGIEDLKNLALGVINSLKRAISRIIDDVVQKKIIEPFVKGFVDKILRPKVPVKPPDPTLVANTTAEEANTAALLANTAALQSKSLQGLLGGEGSNVPGAEGGIASGGIPGPGGTTNLPEAPAPGTIGVEGQTEGIFASIVSKVKVLSHKLEDLATKVFADMSKFFKAIAPKAQSALRQFVGVLAGLGASIAGGIGSGGGGGGGDLSYIGPPRAEGGYTGAGGKWEPAGVVHKGEWVINAERVRQYGHGLFAAIHQGAISPAEIMSYLGNLSRFSVAPRTGHFAMGGMVAEPQGSSGHRGGKSLRIINLLEPSVVTDFLNSSAGEQILLNKIGRNPGRFRSAMGI